MASSESTLTRAKEEDMKWSKLLSSVCLCCEYVLEMPRISSIAKYPECIVILSTCCWGPQLFRVFLSVHQQTPGHWAGQHRGSVMCGSWCKTGRSAWNQNPETSRSVFGLKNVSRGPLTIYYTLTGGVYISMPSIVPWTQTVLSFYKIFGCVPIFGAG